MARKIGADLDSQAESMKKKAAKSKPPSVNITQEVFLKGVSVMADFNRKMDELRGARNAARKQLKAQGVELGMLDATMKMGEWGRDEVRQHFDTQRAYARFYNLPVGSQADLFAGMKPDEIDAKEWEARGQTAGLAGKDPVPPEECPAEHHQAFMVGWHAGQKKLLLAMNEGSTIPKGDYKAPRPDAKPEPKPGTPEFSEKATTDIREYAAKKKAKEAAKVKKPVAKPAAKKGGAKPAAAKPAADDFQEDPPRPKNDDGAAPDQPATVN